MKFLKEDPISTVIAVVFLGAGLFFGIGVTRDYLRFPKVPLEVDASGALVAGQSGRQWVSITAHTWQCDQMIQQGGSRVVPLRLEKGQKIFADFQFNMDCADMTSRPVAGIIEPLSERMHAFLLTSGYKQPDLVGAYEVYVTTADKKQDSLMGVLICFVGAPFFALMRFSLARFFRRFRAQNMQILSDAAAAPEDSPSADWAVRKHGALLLALSIVMYLIGDDWALWGLIPLQRVAMFFAALGSGLIVFPRSYRRLRKRGPAFFGS